MHGRFVEASLLSALLLLCRAPRHRTSVLVAVLPGALSICSNSSRSRLPNETRYASIASVS
jgi:hypothetical protein